MLVVVVAVVEEAGAVETERGGWEVGGTAEDEEEREDVADSAAVGRNKQKHNKTVGGLDSMCCPRLGVVDLLAFGFAFSLSLTHTYHVVVGKTVSKRGSP